MIYSISFVELLSLMLHAKFQNHTLLVQEKIFIKVSGRPSWSCDLDHLYKLLFPLPKTAVTHKRISQMHAGRVDKIVKFNIRLEHVEDTLEACYTRVLYAWCTLI